jgi:hypothetical protein
VLCLCVSQLSVVGNPLCPPMDQATTPQWEHWVASLPPHLHTINGYDTIPLYSTDTAMYATALAEACGVCL